MSYTILEGDCLAALQGIPSESVHCCITSPPYYGLRNYGIEGQVGLEDTPQAYVARLVAIFDEVRRVLRPDGTLFVNLGDSYAPEKQMLGIPWRVAFALQDANWILRSDIIWAKPAPMPESVTDRPTKAHEYVFLLAKSERYFYDAQAIAEESNPKQHAHNQRYAKPYDNIDRIAGGQPNNVNHLGIHSRPGNGTRNKRTVWTIGPEPLKEAHFAVYPTRLPELCLLAGTSARGCCPECGGPWKRVVERSLNNTEGWGQATKDHTGNLQGSNAVIRNGQGRAGDSTTKTVGWEPTCKCPPHQPVPATVLDPFVGSGTTLLAALRNGRHGIGIELNPKYAALARKRLSGVTMPHPEMVLA
jgi:DNA modification methylase